MGIFEIISAIVLIVACVFIVIVVLMKETKTQMSQTISGTSADSFYQKNAGRTKEAMLNKATIVAAIVFFVLALAVNIINVYFGGSSDDSSSTANDAIVEVQTDEADVADEIVAVTIEAAPEENAAATAEAESTPDNASATAEADSDNGAAEDEGSASAAPAATNEAESAVSE